MTGMLAFIRRHPSVFVLVILLVVAVVFAVAVKKEKSTLQTPRADSHAHPSSQASTAPSAAPHAARDSALAEAPGENQVFPFEQETVKVTELAKKLPQSKSQMMAIILKEDIFKSGKRTVRPHTIDEITQRQMGALKVMALRSIMSSETDPGVIRRDLDEVIKNAQDPTIVKIAQAAKDSLDKGRSFFDDFLNGLASLPL